MKTEITGDLNNATIRANGIAISINANEVIAEWDLKTAVFPKGTFRAMAIAFELAEQMGEAGIVEGEA